MATTTNFGWETPDDTDLVKDGALAMRTLGNAIDASLVDLKGGTTGQVLSKNSNTDMDFTWVTSDDANAIQNAIVDAKGDLITATAADTPARLAVGNNGDTLVADSSTSTGLRWQNGVNRNFVINGGMDVWQRGTSFGIGTPNIYTADRFTCGNHPAATVSRQAAGLDGFEYCMRVQRNNGSTNLNDMTVVYNAESSDAIALQGATVTLSFYARKSSTSTSSSLRVEWYSGTGTNQNLWNGAYTGSTTLANTSITLTNSWQRFTFTATMGSSITQTGFYTVYNGTSTASGAADYVEITGFQLEYGSVPTKFKRAGNTLAGELAACQRYYQKSYPQGTAPAAGSAAGMVFGIGMANSSTSTVSQGNNGNAFPVVMRTAPTITFYDNAGNSGKGMFNRAGGTTVNNVICEGVAQDRGISYAYTTGASSLTVGNAVEFAYHYVASAEL